MRMLTYLAIFLLGGVSLATVATSETLLVGAPCWLSLGF